MILWQAYSRICKTTTVSWCRTSSLKRRTLSRRQFTTRENQSRPCSPQSRNSSSSLTSWVHHIHRYRRSTSPTSYYTVRESSGWRFAIGIACWQYRRRWCDLNSFPEISQRAERDVGSHCWRRGHTSCQHSLQCHCRATGSLVTRPSSDVDSDYCAGACGSCVQCGSKHPATVGHTAAANSVDDANHTDA